MIGKPEDIQRISKIIALLDAIICPEWEYRYYSYNSNWSEHGEMASMRDGSGDEYVFWFCHEFCAMKCVTHEYPLIQNIEHIIRHVPHQYSPFIDEPAFMVHDSTILGFWDNEQWEIYGHINHDIQSMLTILDGKPDTYIQWAEDYYERDVERNMIELIYANAPLNNEIIMSLNNGIDVLSFQHDIHEIGYVGS